MYYGLWPTTTGHAGPVGPVSVKSDNISKRYQIKVSSDYVIRVLLTGKSFGTKIKVNGQAVLEI